MKAKRMGILLWFTAPLSAFSLQRDVMRVTKMLFYRRIYCGTYSLRARMCASSLHVSSVYFFDGRSRSRSYWDDGKPGVSDLGAQVIVSEIGTDMSRFPFEGHLISWAGMRPRNDESAGKRRSNRLRKGAPWLKTTLVQCAWAAVRNSLVKRAEKAERPRLSVSQMLARIRQHIVAVDTQGGNRMRESCTYGSLRGVRGNSHPYRDTALCTHDAASAHVGSWHKAA